MSHPAVRSKWSLDPVLMMLAALALAVALTWIIPSGKFERTAKGLVKADTFQVLPKEANWSALMPSKAEEAKPAETKAGTGEAKATPAMNTEVKNAGTRTADGKTPEARSAEAKAPEAKAAKEPAKLRPVSPVAIVTAIPAGMVSAAGLIFMITALGGMFGVLRATGTLEAAIERLLAVTGGRLVLLTPVLMLAISAGGSFIGLISEYLLIIPIFLALSKRLGLDAMFGFAVVTVSAKIGYIASVTNPVILVVAQPIAGVPVFSGLGFRLGVWIVFMALGIAFVLRGARGQLTQPVTPAESAKLSSRHIAIVLLLTACVGLLICGAWLWKWKDVDFAAVYVTLGALIALCAGMAPRVAAKHFVDGMKSMVLAGLLVGMAKGVEVILSDGQILDTIVNVLASFARDLPPALVGSGLVLVEMFLGLLIPSGSAKAALSMPILVPIGHVAGVSGQTVVLAFVLGNGLINLFAPTSGMLLAYLATAEVTYTRWFKYILPLFGLLTALALLTVSLAVWTGY